ncbi:MAG: archease [Dehalococcoidales bacterium]|nr:MAG: archease [Dehalococcoidales bacterium]
MDKRFEILDHTADTGIIAYGIDLKQAFENVAVGMFSIITDLGSIENNQVRRIDINASDRDSLLVSWLNELIYLFDVDNLIFSIFDIIHLDESNLSAIAHGEKADLSRHEIRTGIKAATYHMLKIDENDLCRVQVLFDI